MTDQNFSGASTPKGRRNDVVAAEKDQFGGMKFGSAFFGWLTATGMALLLTALASAIGAGVGVATNTDPGQVAQQATQDATTVGIVGGILLGLILLIAYFCGATWPGAWHASTGRSRGSRCGCGRS